MKPLIAPATPWSPLCKIFYNGVLFLFWSPNLSPILPKAISPKTSAEKFFTPAKRASSILSPFNTPKPVLIHSFKAFLGKTFIFPYNPNLLIKPWVTPAHRALKPAAFKVSELKTSFKTFPILKSFAAKEVATFEDMNAKVAVAIFDKTTLLATPNALTKEPEKQPTDIAEAAIPITANAAPEID